MGLFNRMFNRRLSSMKRPRRERMAMQLDELRRSGVRIGDNVAIYNCIIDSSFPFLIEIGAGSIVTHATILAHDASAIVMGAGIVVGRVSVGRRCFIGAGAVILPGVAIGDDSIVGAGSVVTKDIPEGVIAAGNPCKVLRPR